MTMDSDKANDILTNVTQWFLGICMWIVLIGIIIVCIPDSILPKNILPENGIISQALGSIFTIGMFGPIVFIIGLLFVLTVWKLWCLFKWYKSGGPLRLSVKERIQWNNAIFASLWIAFATLMLIIYDDADTILMCFIVGIVSFFLASACFGIFEITIDSTGSQPASPPEHHDS